MFSYNNTPQIKLAPRVIIVKNIINANLIVFIIFVLIVNMTVLFLYPETELSLGFD